MSDDLTLQERLLKVQSELKVPKNQFNSFGSYNYRNAEDILEAVKPLLDKYKLTCIITDKIKNIGERYYIESTVSIQSGDQVLKVSAQARETESKKGMDEAQVTGSASSYARKYALNGMFLIDDTKDADSQDNSQSKTVKKKVIPTNGDFKQEPVVVGTTEKPWMSEEEKDTIVDNLRKATDPIKAKAYVDKKLSEFKSKIVYREEIQHALDDVSVKEVVEDDDGLPF